MHDTDKVIHINLMDSHANNAHSQCHLDTTMDSPANFYEYDIGIDKPYTVKQEPFDIEESNVGLGDFLHSEETVDLQAYLERFDNINNIHHTTALTAGEIVPQLVAAAGGIATQQRFLNEVPAVTSGAQPIQHSEHSQQHSGGQMHYENQLQQAAAAVMMPLNAPQAHVVSEQSADSIVPEHFMANYVVEVHSSTSTSNASSPGLPNDTACSSTDGAGKRKRPTPEPGTHEYKQKRERNNIAVRKSREKTKQKNQELQEKVGELQGENSGLKKRVEMLTKELTVLKSLFTNVGKSGPMRLEKAVE